ncbi:MAG: hypothetical protein U1F16_05255 [Turneriella sp.]
MDHELRKRLKISENEGVMVSHAENIGFFRSFLPLDIILRVNGDVVSALRVKIYSRLSANSPTCRLAKFVSIFCVQARSCS